MATEKDEEIASEKNRGGQAQAPQKAQAPQATQTTKSPQKPKLEDVLGSSNFQVYHTAASAIDSYMRMKNQPSFSIKAAGMDLYKALKGMANEISDSTERADLQMKVDVMELNIRDGTLTNQALDSTVEYLRSFLQPYLNKIKNNIDPEHHKLMAMSIVQNKDRFPEEFGKLATVPGGSNVVQLGIVLAQLNDVMKKNDFSGLPDFYKKLTPSNIQESYMKLGMTKEEAEKTVAAGVKCYTDLVNALSDNAKQEHAMHVNNILQRELYNGTRNIDSTALKNTLESFDPANYLNLLIEPMKQAAAS